MNDVEFWKLFWSIMGPLILGALTWIGNSFRKWASSKAKNEKDRELINKINDIIFDAVISITQSFVDTLKKNNGFTPEAQQEAKEKAYAIINSQLTVELKQFIQDNYGDVKEFIMNKIEAVLWQTKK